MRVGKFLLATSVHLIVCCPVLVFARNRQMSDPERLQIDPIVTTDEGIKIGLAAVGLAMDVHEASLFLQTQTFDDRLFRFANRFTAWSEQERSDEEDYDDEIAQNEQDEDNDKDCVLGTLWPVVAGEWLAEDLLTLTGESLTGSPDEHFYPCGKVFWSKERVGDAARAVAKRIQQDICLQGNAAMYNCRSEPPEFERLGGRIISRGEWMFPKETPRNRALPDNHPNKMHIQDYYSDFLFTPSLATYLDDVWPQLKSQRMVTSPERRTDGNEFVSHIEMPTGEYLSGRILTIPVVYGGSAINAAHLLVVFNYDCPDMLDEAFVGDTPISGPHSAQFLTVEKFLSFVLDANTTTEELRIAFESISTSRIVNVARDYVLGNKKSSIDDLVRIMQRIVPAIYENQGIPNAPSYRSFMVYDPKEDDKILFEAFVLSLYQIGKLEALVDELQSEFDASGPPPPPFPPPLPSVLLKHCPSLACTDALIGAGTLVDWDVVIHFVKEPSESYSTALLQHLTQKFVESHSDSDGLDPLLVAWVPEAVRRLDAAALAHSLKYVSEHGLELLFRDERIEIFDPPEVVPCLARQPPPSARGSIRQVASAAFISQYGDYLLALTMDRYTEEETVLLLEDNFLQTVRVLEKYRTGKPFKLENYSTTPETCFSHRGKWEQVHRTTKQKLVGSARCTLAKLLLTFSESERRVGPCDAELQCPARQAVKLVAG